MRKSHLGWAGPLVPLLSGEAGGVGAGSDPLPSALAPAPAPVCLSAECFVCAQAKPASQGQMTTRFESVIYQVGAGAPAHMAESAGKCFTFETSPPTWVLFYEMAPHVVLRLGRH